MSTIEKISEYLNYRQVSGSHTDHELNDNPLTHLTSLIDRTEDLYSFAPLYQADKSNSKIPSDYVQIFLCPVPRRIISRTDNDLIMTKMETDPDIEKLKKARFAEIVWTKPNESPFRLTEPSIGYDQNKWCSNTILILNKIYEHCRNDRFLKNKRGIENVIYFPEFGFPPIMDRTLRNRFLRSVMESVWPKNIEDLVGYSDFLFLGSFHDINDNSNLGVTVPYGYWPVDTTFKKSYQHQSLDGIYYQRKRHASKKLGEVLQPVDTLEFPIFMKKDINVATLICSDIYDVSLTLSLVRYNLRCIRGAEIDLIVVPSFNKSDKLIEACRQLSYLMGNIVAYCTSYSASDSTLDKQISSDSKLFICGHDLSIGSKTLEYPSDTSKYVSYKRIQVSEYCDDNVFIDSYLIDISKLSLLRYVTRKNYPSEVVQAGRRVHSIGIF